MFRENICIQTLAGVVYRGVEIQNNLNLSSLGSNPLTCTHNEMYTLS